MKEATVVKSFAAIALLFAFLFALPSARADEANQATKVTFSQPVQIPGRVLPAGTYWFILPENIDDHNEVRIYNSDQKMVFGTFLTADAERLKPTDKTTFTFTEADSMQPQSIVTWFYPGRLDGHQFLYPKQAQKELAKDKQVTVVAGK